MTENYYWDEGDFIAQLLYHIVNKPDNCLSKLIIEWYNSLYSELSTNPIFECCELNDINDANNADILAFLTKFGYSALQGTLTQFLITELVQFGLAAGEQAIDDLSAEVKEQIVLQLGAPV